MTAPVTDVCRACGAPIKPETFEKRVLVTTEGTADAAFIEQLAKNRGIPDLQAVRPANGKDFTRRLRSMRGFAPDTSTILIVTDSDDRAAETFGEIREQIRNVGDYGLPSRPLEVARGRGVSAVAVVTIPWIDRPGNLETLVLDALSDSAPTIRAEVSTLLRTTVKSARSVSKDSKAHFSCTVACICDDDPSCSISAMWQASKGFQGLLGHKSFDTLAEFLRSL